jgi:hypothetical protein
MTVRMPTITRGQAGTILLTTAAAAGTMAIGALVLERTAMVLLSAIVMTVAFTVLGASIGDDVEPATTDLRSDLTANLVAATIVAAFLAIVTAGTGYGS